MTDLAEAGVRVYRYIAGRTDEEYREGYGLEAHGQSSVGKA